MVEAAGAKLPKPVGGEFSVARQQGRANELAIRIGPARIDDTGHFTQIALGWARGRARLGDTSQPSERPTAYITLTPPHAAIGV